jgi:hypothetical protein
MVIIQPGRSGDIVICLPIAKWYSRNYEVFWPCASEYTDLLEAAPYVNVRPLDDDMEVVLAKTYSRIDKFSAVVDLSFGFAHGKAVHLWDAHGSESFVSLKYRIAGVPSEERWNLTYLRSLGREEALYREIVGSEGKPYTFVHDESWHGLYRVPNPTYRPVRPRRVPGFNLLDWRKILGEASEILCIDSSFANFVEVIPECREILKSITFVTALKGQRSTYRSKWRVLDETR